MKIIRNILKSLVVTHGEEGIMKKVMPLMILLFTVLVALAAAVTWELNPEQSAVTFKIKNFGRQVDGTFKGMKAKIKFDEQNPKNSDMEASIDVNTIDTGIKKRDKDLKSSGYFDVGKYPEIRFKSKNISKSGKGYSALGDLTIKDVTRQVEIPFTFENQGKHGVFRGALSLDRLDYHVGGKSRILGDHVDINIVADVNNVSVTTRR
jgi:polyisoprenoid-binding protein YceI